MTSFHQGVNEELDMELKCVVAVVRPEVLQTLEKRLGAIDIHGISVHEKLT